MSTLKALDNCLRALPVDPVDADVQGGLEPFDVVAARAWLERRQLRGARRHGKHSHEHEREQECPRADASF
jgi:hypothetical protein